MKLTLNPGQKLWFTSDTHYNHSNICSGTTNWKDAKDLTRDFQTLERMNRKLIENINASVAKDDILIHLGDWSFGGFDKIQEFRDRIICSNIHLVLGNHDHHILNNKGDIRALFSSVHEYLPLNVSRPSLTDKGRVDKYRFICMHYPIASWDGMNDGNIHLHGHVHLPKDLRIGDGRSMDVGVDGNNLYPISLDEILNLMDGRPVRKLVLPQDHHEKRV